MTPVTPGWLPAAFDGLVGEDQQFLRRTDRSNHGTVDHSANEYARLGGFVHINTAECRFSLMKRAVYGTHHSISEAHLPRYLSEWDYKWNTRKMTDVERAAVAVKGGEGKRLQYRQPRGAAYA
jgi:hypothetical protein